jgi:hypothetical protein
MFEQFVFSNPFVVLCYMYKLHEKICKPCSSARTQKFRVTKIEGNSIKRGSIFDSHWDLFLLWSRKWLGPIFVLKQNCIPTYYSLKCPPDDWKKVSWV